MRLDLCFILFNRKTFFIAGDQALGSSDDKLIWVDLLG